MTRTSREVWRSGLQQTINDLPIREFIETMSVSDALVTIIVIAFFARLAYGIADFTISFRKKCKCQEKEE